MCDKAVDGGPSLLNFVTDWFVMNKMFEDLDIAVFSNDNIVFVNVDSSVTFFSVLLM